MAVAAGPAWWDEFVKHAAWAQQRVDAPLGGVGLDAPVIAMRFAGGAGTAVQNERSRYTMGQLLLRQVFPTNS